MNKSHNSSTPKIIGGLTLGFIAIIAVYLFVVQPIISDDDNQKVNQTTQNVATQTNDDEYEDDYEDDDEVGQQQTDTTGNTDTPAGNSSSYSDGSYTSSASYNVPHGSNSISINITLKGDKITALSTDNNYTDHESERYISRFDGAIEQEVLNVPISDISLSRVGGASLTTSAFNRALQLALDKAN